MGRTAVIQARIDPKVKAKARKVFDALNISMSEAISLYLTQVALHRGIPFEIRVPNEETAEALRAVNRGEGLTEVDNVDELMEELGV